MFECGCSFETIFIRILGFGLSQGRLQRDGRCDLAAVTVVPICDAMRTIDPSAVSMRFYCAFCVRFLDPN